MSPITLRESDSRFAPLDNVPLIRSDAPPDTGWDDWTNETIDYVPVPQSLLDGLAAMSQRPEIEVAWATTWEENANWLFEDLGMGTRLPVYLFASHDDEPVTKWSTVVDQYERRRLPFVWIDDRRGVDEAAWAQSLDVDSLLIRTNTFHGITRECWAHIEAWIDHQLTQTPGGR